MNLSKRKWIIIMVCVVAIFSLTACSPSDVFNNTVAFVNEKADAYRAACDTLREQLRAPSEAVFPTYKSSFVSELRSDDLSYDTMYSISAYVDAENSAGATERKNWSARVYSKKDEKQFYVVLDGFDSDSFESDNSDDTGSSYGSDSSSSFGSYSTNNNSNYSSGYSSSSDNSYSNNYSDSYDDFYDEDEDDYYDYEDEYEDDYDYEDSTSEYILPESDSRKLTKSDLYGLSKEELRIARNEIYARHGRRFQDEELQEYFDEQDWYDGYIDPEDFVDSQMLSKLERRNAKFILKFE